MLLTAYIIISIMVLVIILYNFQDSPIKPVMAVLVFSLFFMYFHKSNEHQLYLQKYVMVADQLGIEMKNSEEQKMLSRLKEAGIVE